MLLWEEFRMFCIVNNHGKLMLFRKCYTLPQIWIKCWNFQQRTPLRFFQVTKHFQCVSITTRLKYKLGEHDTQKINI